MRKSRTFYKETLDCREIKVRMLYYSNDLKIDFIVSDSQWESGVVKKFTIELLFSLAYKVRYI